MTGLDAIVAQAIIILAWPRVLYNPPMRRIAVIALVILPLVALVVGWLIWTRPPALVVSLRALPEVAKVEYTGAANEARKND